MALSHAKTITVVDGTDTNVLLPSDWNSRHNRYYTLSGNTTNSSVISGNIVFSAANGITLGGSTQTSNPRLFISGGQQAHPVLVLNQEFEYTSLANAWPGSMGYMTIREYSCDHHYNRGGLDNGYYVVSLSAATAANNSAAGFIGQLKLGVYTRTGNTLSLLVSEDMGNEQNITYSSNGTGSINGLRAFRIGFPANSATTTVGHYYIGIWFSSNATGNVNSTANSTSLGKSMTMYGNDRIDSAANRVFPFGSTTNNSSGLHHYGIYSTTFTSNLPSSIGLSNQIIWGASSANHGLFGIRFGDMGFWQNVGIQ